MITINNKTYKGNNVTIVNNQIYIDDKLADTKDEKNIKISIDGDVDTLNIDHCDEILINGDCGSVKCGNGNVKCGNVGGNVKSTNGNVKCGNVDGDIKTTNGNIKRL